MISFLFQFPIVDDMRVAVRWMAQRPFMCVCVRVWANENANKIKTMQVNERTVGSPLGKKSAMMTKHVCTAAAVKGNNYINKEERLEKWHQQNRSVSCYNNMEKSQTMNNWTVCFDDVHRSSIKKQTQQHHPDAIDEKFLDIYDRDKDEIRVFLSAAQ